MVVLYLPALVIGFLITLLEMTEVVALVFALSSEHGSIRSGAYGAAAGTTVVSVAALAFGAILIAFPRGLLLWASAIVLAGFGVFLFRSTLRAYLRKAVVHVPEATSTPTRAHAMQFAGGFSVGVVESVEAVIVLLALAAAGYGLSAVVGAVAGGVVLVGAAAVVHEQIRKIKLPWLKLGATSLLFSFAIFWGGEAAGLAWPGGDLILVPLVIVIAALVRGVIGLRLSPNVPVETKS